MWWAYTRGGLYSGEGVLYSEVYGITQGEINLLDKTQLREHMKQPDL